MDKAKERSALCLQLDRLDPAEKALATALSQDVLASGQSFRRRGAALTDFASIGARRHDPDQVLADGREALHLARATSSGYVAINSRGYEPTSAPLPATPVWSNWAPRSTHCARRDERGRHVAGRGRTSVP
ncbi:hypothetical protein [Streptomyces sp. S1A1-7]|uniref:hypothetical protein n=1 Tax=Streptomyces sp. S1A1-7 TaxID=2594459 RepID=UPI00196805FE